MRWRLALLVTAAMALVLVAFLVPLALLVRAIAAERAVNSATTEAQSLSAIVATADPQSLRLTVDQVNAAGRYPVTVYLPDGQVVGAPVARTPAVALATRGESFSVAQPDGREIVIAVQGLPGGTAVIRSFVSEAELRRGVTRAWLVLTLVGVALLGLGLAVADRLAVMVVRPIRALARTSEMLASGDLDARAEIPAGPPEVRGVAAALNHLAGRIRELLRQEREAVADLSHRMRTPMTALRLDAEGLRDPDDATRILEHVAALDHAVTAVISDARRAKEPATCDAAGVVAERVRFWKVLAEDQARAVQTRLDPGPLPVAVGAADLAACVDALLGNVFAHTEEGAAFAVTLTPRPGGGAVLVVSDAGTGFTRPVTGRGVSGAGSTGLGLDIVRQAADASGGTLVIDRSPTGGAQVTASFGPPDPDEGGDPF